MSDDLQVAATRKELEAVEAEIRLEQVKMAADVAGIVDPTPTSDAISGGIAIKQGEWGDAGLSALAMIPYLGDLTKGIKAAKLSAKMAKLLERAAELKSRLHKLMRAGDEAKVAREVPPKLPGKFPENAPSARALCPDAEKIVDKIGPGVKNHPLRKAYEEEVAGLGGQARSMLQAGKLEQEVAMAMTEARRGLGVKYKDATPEPLREYIYDVNRKRYGDPLGPTYEHLKRLGKTDAEIIQGASRPNPDVDKLLSGFSDWLGTQDADKLRRWAEAMK